MHAPLPFRIDTSPLGTQVVVDGRDVTAHVDAVAFTAAVGDPPCLTLHCAPGAGVLAGHAVIHVSEPGLDPDAVCAWLDDLDPDELERDALAAADMSTSPTAAILDMLRHYLSGPGT